MCIRDSRSPVGRRGGGLAGVHPADLSAHVMRAAVETAAIDPAAVDDVVWGCVDQVGAQATNIARTGWLSAGLPESVPGTTVDRQCGSSQQAVSFAAYGILAGQQDLVLAGGVEVMSLVPIWSPASCLLYTSPGRHLEVQVYRAGQRPRSRPRSRRA